MTCHRGLAAPVPARIIDITTERLRRGHEVPPCASASLPQRSAAHAAAPLSAAATARGVGPVSGSASHLCGSGAGVDLRIGDRAVLTLSDGRTVAARGTIVAALDRPWLGTPYLLRLRRDDGRDGWYSDSDLRPEPDPDPDPDPELVPVPEPAA